MAEGKKTGRSPGAKGPRRSSPPPAGIILEGAAEKIDEDPATPESPDKTSPDKTDADTRSSAGPATEDRSDDTPDPDADGSRPPRRFLGPGLASLLAGLALVSALAAAGLAGYTYQHSAKLTAQQDEIITRLELLDQRIAEMADAALLRQQAEELNSFGARLDAVTKDIGAALEQIDTLGNTVTRQLAAPSREIISALQQRLDEIDRSLAEMSDKAPTPEAAAPLAEPNKADPDRGAAPGNTPEASPETTPSATPTPPAAAAQENSSGWLGWIGDLIRIERLDGSE